MQLSAWQLPLRSETRFLPSSRFTTASLLQTKEAKKAALTPNSSPLLQHKTETPTFSWPNKHQAMVSLTLPSHRSEPPPIPRPFDLRPHRNHCRSQRRYLLFFARQADTLSFCLPRKALRQTGHRAFSATLLRQLQPPCHCFSDPVCSLRHWQPRERFVFLARPNLHPTGSREPPEPSPIEAKSLLLRRSSHAGSSLPSPSIVVATTKAQTAATEAAAMVTVEEQFDRNDFAGDNQDEIEGVIETKVTKTRRRRFISTGHGHHRVYGNQAGIWHGMIHVLFQTVSGSEEKERRALMRWNSTMRKQPGRENPDPKRKRCLGERVDPWVVGRVGVCRRSCLIRRGNQVLPRPWKRLQSGHARDPKRHRLSLPLRGRGRAEAAPITGSDSVPRGQWRCDMRGWVSSLERDLGLSFVMVGDGDLRERLVVAGLREDEVEGEGGGRRGEKEKRVVNSGTP
ncbi:hypothetical protein LR48_Vigan10g076700 [Vigna angularis]|uniref:Uncharacterized protein n=1 Tax=Phaseolus angularis TaxID=3914 RepID=A0A0L9VIH8_PHAAN|nr:hypothetical protein LR48_Vigan10g076700 [Vigna angularis]